MNLYFFCFFFRFSFLFLIVFHSDLLAENNGSNGGNDASKDDIMSLTIEDFESFVSDESRHTFLVVYAPWCHWSNLLLSDLEKIKVLLKYDDQVKIAKVNASVNGEILEKLNVYGYPSLFMIHKEKIDRYINSRTVRNIVLWIYSILQDSSVYEMKTVEKLEIYIEYEENNNSIVFFVNKENEDETLLKSLNSMCLEVNASFCFYIKEKHVIDYLEKQIMPQKNFSMSPYQQNKKLYTVVYKNNKFENYFQMQEEELDIIYDLSLPHEIRLDTLKTFILENAESLVLQFSELYYHVLFVPDVVTLFIIYNDKSDLSKNDIINAAKKYKNKIIVCISGSQKVSEKRLLSELLIEEVNKPIMRIIEFKDQVDIPLKYKPINDDVQIDEQSIDEFIEGYMNGRKYFYRKSEHPLPEEFNNGYVKIIVADTYDDYIFKNDKNILVLYYAPWCGHCRKFEPIYRELGKRLSIYSTKFKDYKNDIIISKIDAANNEIYNITISGYPSLYLYEKSNKKEPIQYTGMRTVQDIISWVTEKTSSNLDVAKLLSLSLDEEQLFENYEEL